MSTQLTNSLMEYPQLEPSGPWGGKKKGTMPSWLYPVIHHSPPLNLNFPICAMGTVPVPAPKAG